VQYSFMFQSHATCTYSRDTASFHSLPLAAVDLGFKDRGARSSIMVGDRSPTGVNGQSFSNSLKPQSNIILHNYRVELLL